MRKQDVLIDILNAVVHIDLGTRMDFSVHWLYHTDLKKDFHFLLQYAQNPFHKVGAAVPRAKLDRTSQIWLLESFPFRFEIHSHPILWGKFLKKKVSSKVRNKKKTHGFPSLISNFAIWQFIPHWEEKIRLFSFWALGSLSLSRKWVFFRDNRYEGNG